MSEATHILLWTSSAGAQSPRVELLREALTDAQLNYLEHSAASVPSVSARWAIVHWDPGIGSEILKAYAQKQRAKGTLDFVVLVSGATFPPALKAALSPKWVLDSEESIGEMLSDVARTAAPRPRAPEELTNQNPTLSRTAMGSDDELGALLVDSLSDVGSLAMEDSANDEGLAISDTSESMLDDDLDFEIEEISGALEGTHGVSASQLDPVLNELPVDGDNDGVDDDEQKTQVKMQSQADAQLEEDILNEQFSEDSPISSMVVDMGKDLSEDSVAGLLFEDLELSEGESEIEKPKLPNPPPSLPTSHQSSRPKPPTKRGAFEEKSPVGPRDMSDDSVLTAVGALDDELKTRVGGLDQFEALDSNHASLQDDADNGLNDFGMDAVDSDAENSDAENDGDNSQDIGTDESIVVSLDEGLSADLESEDSASLVVSASDGVDLSEPVAGTDVAEISRIIENSLPSSAEVETVKRYAALKEREARERDATIDVLRKQLSQFKERAERSESERRKMTMSVDELELQIRSLEDLRDQHQFHVDKLKATAQEELRALQLRFDNTQFQAQKAEKKLEEFRDRVRNDILKIRMRERELANKLELQKRDAEALLTAKDERLLAQKRNIDRLEFEIESLKERMIDETSRAEERAAKLSRALRSLRMAQGMLSGIDEEVLPGSDIGDDGEGEAA